MIKCHCVHRCIENLEAKLTAAQTAYDTFVASKAELGDGARSSPNLGLNKFQHHACMDGCMHVHAPTYARYLILSVANTRVHGCACCPPL